MISLGEDRSETLDGVQVLKINTSQEDLTEDDKWLWFKYHCGKLKEEIFTCLSQLLFVIFDTILMFSFL